MSIGAPASAPLRASASSARDNSAFADAASGLPSRPPAAEYRASASCAHDAASRFAAAFAAIFSLTASAASHAEASIRSRAAFLTRVDLLLELFLLLRCYEVV